MTNMHPVFAQSSLPSSRFESMDGLGADAIVEALCAEHAAAESAERADRHAASERRFRASEKALGEERRAAKLTFAASMLTSAASLVRSSSELGQAVHAQRSATSGGAAGSDSSSPGGAAGGGEGGGAAAQATRMGLDVVRLGASIVEGRAGRASLAAKGHRIEAERAEEAATSSREQARREIELRDGLLRTAEAIRQARHQAEERALGR